MGKKKNNKQQQEQQVCVKLSSSKFEEIKQLREDCKCFDNQELVMMSLRILSTIVKAEKENKQTIIIGGGFPERFNILHQDISSINSDEVGFTGSILQPNEEEDKMVDLLNISSIFNNVGKYFRYTGYFATLYILWIYILNNI